LDLDEEIDKIRKTVVEENHNLGEELSVLKFGGYCNQKIFMSLENHLAKALEGLNFMVT
jgi:hypothetical protein